MISVSALNELTRIRHGFFTREGGTSAGLYASLNCGFGSGDDPASVAANRAQAMAMLNRRPEALVTVRQEHTARAVTVDAPWSHADAPVADAMVTTRPGIVLGILTADCAPVLLADPRAGVIGAAHAGWKGAIGGIIDATVAAMVVLGARPENIVAAVGPCIAQRSYEVGPGFPAPFLAEDGGNVAFFAPSRREEHHMFDLVGYVVWRIARRGVGTVVRTPCDTMREEGRFFSYRRATLRGESDYGRGLSAIVLEK
ncbi:MAG: peptidoglycan editing factor PgeF [Alphaproteobacteria bacterium]